MFKQNYLNLLLNSSNNFKQLQDCVEWVSPAITLYCPLEFYHSSNKGLGLKSKTKIKQGQEICLVSTEKCITGKELVDCDRNKCLIIDEMTQKLAQKFYPKNQSQYFNMINVQKIALQIQVQNINPNLSMGAYAKFLLSSKNTNVPIYWTSEILKQNFSTNLQSLIFSTQKQYRQMHDELKQNNIFGMTFQEYADILTVIRSRQLQFLPENPKEFTKDHVMIMCPIIEMCNHNFKPNCVLEGKYNAHESKSYVVLRANQDIDENQELFLNYGNYSNHEMLMRFGFLDEANQFNEMTIGLDFDDFLQFTECQFEFKQKILRTTTITDVSLDSIKLYQSKINQDILRLLRLYFLSNDDIKMNPKIYQFLWKDFSDIISTQNEIAVCKFMIHTLKLQLKNYLEKKMSKLNFDYLKINQTDIIDINNKNDVKKLQDTNFKNLMTLGLEEEEIIKKNLAFFEKKLNQFQI